MHVLGRSLLRISEKYFLSRPCKVHVLGRSLLRNFAAAMDRDSLRQVHQFFTACDQVGVYVDIDIRGNPISCSI